MAVRVVTRWERRSCLRILSFVLIPMLLLILPARMSISRMMAQAPFGLVTVGRFSERQAAMKFFTVEYEQEEDGC
jgi:hypothetical protein